MDLELYQESIFEDIKHVDENGKEYWLARELMKALNYIEWRKFKQVINKAIVSCSTSKTNPVDHFVSAAKMIEIAKGGKREVEDYKLSRYACYLIVQNGDARKREIALGQTYFAIQTRKMEITEKEYEELSEDDRRLYKRKQIRNGNYELNQTAKKAGVKNFDKFHNSGYKGLYNGETADDIAKRKGLRYREDILDNMCSEELVDNLFRIIHTEQKLKRDNIHGEKEANIVHYNMGKDIRKFIEKQGGTMPEDLSTPNKSIKELKKNELKKINGGGILNIILNLSRGNYGK